MKSLADQLRELEPECLGTMPDHDTQDVIDFTSRKDYDKLKQVAVILAEALAVEKAFLSMRGMLPLDKGHHILIAETKAQALIGGE